MSNPYEPPSDPWNDPSRPVPPPAPPSDAPAGTPAPPTAVPDFQVPPTPPQQYAPQYPVPVQQYPAPPQYPAPAHLPPGVPYQPAGPSYPPPAYPGTPPYVPAPPYPGQPGQAPPGYPYGYQGWAPPPPPKPKSRVGLIVGIAVGVVVLCLAGLGTLVAIGLNKANQLAGPAHVVAEVTGTGPTLVTFSIVGPDSTGPDGETGTHPVPYTITRDVPRDGSIVTVIVQTVSPGGSATCRILVDGTVEMTRTASGFNARAVCEATV